VSADADAIRDELDDVTIERDVLAHRVATLGQVA
jgi:hypothetical protein